MYISRFFAEMLENTRKYHAFQRVYKDASNGVVQALVNAARVSVGSEFGCFCFP